MVFASFPFLFLFLPLFLAVYYAAPARRRNWVILLFSWAFYAWWRVDFLLLLAGVTGFTYAVGRLMGAAGPGTPRARRLMAVGLAGDLGVLAWFKYANFGVATFNGLAGAFGRAPAAWTEVVLPIGLSFYVLQSISYLVDVGRGDVPACRSFLDYAAYKAVFSQLIAGPIVRYAEIERDLRRRHHSLREFGIGSRTFMVGFAMKVALADALSPVADAAFALPRPTLADAWLGASSYTLQLYFDFAGYSLMAIGLARMIGFHFPQNFDHPYLASSIQDFWQRWHITLSRFLRDYLYIPLGGNRRGPLRTYVNLMEVMAIGGLWHGASWTFVVWGLWHGALLGAHRRWSRRAARAGDRLQDRPQFRPQARPQSRTQASMPYPVANALTLLAVVLGWVLFRAPDMGGAVAVYRGMAGLNGLPLSDALAWRVTPDRLAALPIAAALVYAPLLRARWRRARAEAAEAAEAAGAAARGPAGLALWTAAPPAGFALAVVLLYSRDAVPFLYFQF